MKVSVALFGVVLSTASPLPCFAGPCSAEIDATMSQIDAGTRGRRSGRAGGRGDRGGDEAPSANTKIDCRVGSQVGRRFDQVGGRGRKCDGASAQRRPRGRWRRLRGCAGRRSKGARALTNARPPAKHFSKPRISSARTSQPHDFPWMQALEPPPEPAAVDRGGGKNETGCRVAPAAGLRGPASSSSPRAAAGRACLRLDWGRGDHENDVMLPKCISSSKALDT